MFRGHFGEIRRADGGFEVELRGLAEALNAPVGRSILRRCDRVLGDGKCGFDLSDAGYSAETEAVSGSDGRSHRGGRARGLRRRLVRARDADLAERGERGTTAHVKSDRSARAGGCSSSGSSRPRPVASGDRFRVVAGCDKAAATCGEKFDNFLNFRGFPHIPGEDWVTAYPKDGAIHDGASLQGP